MTTPEREPHQTARRGERGRDADPEPARRRHPLLELQRATGNRVTRLVVRRLPVTATDLGSGALRVDVGGDFISNHMAGDWVDAVTRSARRWDNGSPQAIKTNTIVPDVEDMKSKVAATNYPYQPGEHGKAMKTLKVPGVKLWQIDTRQADVDVKANTIPPEPAPTTGEVELKTKLAKDDDNVHSPGAATWDGQGPVLVVTGVFKVPNAVQAQPRGGNRNQQNRGGPGNQGNRGGPGNQGNRGGPGNQQNRGGPGNQQNRGGPGNPQNRGGPGD